MSANTSIAWTDKSWNPVRGCSIVSPGCSNCYAMRQAYRFSGAGQPYEGLTRMTSHGPVWTGKIRLVPEALDEPLHWKKPCRVFVNSMSDLFHEDVPDEFIDSVFAIMAIAPRHVFQVLTKRPQRMQEWMVSFRREQTAGEKLFESLPEDVLADGPKSMQIEKEITRIVWPLPNVHLGVSVENQETADERIPILLQTPSAVRFLSVEPLLEPINIAKACAPLYRKGIACSAYSGCRPGDAIPSQDLHWVIVGGESGPNARPCNIAWLREIVVQCRAADVPVFVKQLGSASDWRVPNEQLAAEGAAAVECQHGFDACPKCDSGISPMTDRKGGDPAEWPPDLRIREFPR